SYATYTTASFNVTAGSQPSPSSASIPPGRTIPPCSTRPVSSGSDKTPALQVFTRPQVVTAPASRTGREQSPTSGPGGARSCPEPRRPGEKGGDAKGQPHFLTGRTWVTTFALLSLV